MFKTTVVWPQTPGADRHPTIEQGIALTNYADTLCGGDFFPTLSTVENSDTIVVTREWPSLEIAETWVKYILENYNVTSAVVNS